MSFNLTCFRRKTSRPKVARSVLPAIIGALIWGLGPFGPAPQQFGTASAQSVSGARFPSFELVGRLGAKHTGATLFEKPSVVHFGFTRCPVICPTTLYEMAERMNSLGASAVDYNFIFITVDPERDTPDALDEYLNSFDDRIVGLSGKPEEVQKIAMWLGAQYSKVATSNGDYTMDHSANAFLVARGGVLVSSLYMGYGAKEAQTLSALSALLKIK